MKELLSGLFFVFLLVVSWFGIVAATFFFCSLLTGCASAPPTYFEGWNGASVNSSDKRESYTRPEAFDIREGASYE